MSTRKLLISAAAAALMAGGASALTLTQGDSGTAGPVEAGASAVVYNAAGLVAEEASFAAVGDENGIFQLVLTSTGTFAASENYFIDVTVSGGTFYQDLTGGEVVNGTVSVTGSSVQIAGQAQTGQTGENAVRFLASTGPAAANSLGIELPVAFAGCPDDLTFTVSIETESGTTFEEGTVSLAAPALACVNAYQGTISTDIVAGANDSLLASTAFTNYVAGTPTSDTDQNTDGAGDGIVNDTTTVATHGVVTLEWNPAGTAGTIYSSLTPQVILTGAAAEVDSVDFDVNVTNPTGLTSAGMRQDGDTDAFTAGGVSSLTATIGTAIGTNDYIDNIILTVTGAAQVAQQDVTTTNGLVDFGAATLVASESVADATLDDLNYEGETCGTFDWVGDSTKPTQNIFRVTGAGATTSAVIATLSNSSNGTSFDGSYNLTTAFDFTQNEVIINATHLTTDAGEFGRADILLNFIGASTSLDCDRLMNSDASNIITPFGNKNQAAAAGDDGDDD
ncbi:MAG: hypothetical protein VXW22_06225 [Pseudomonadota bacterium]|nr:hypothetical protein [Pseudomonadota bacterium]